MSSPPPVALATVLREWGRIGCVGFGGPPAHIALLRKLCVEDRKWLDPREFEDAIAACNLLPGPASTQLAIFCAWRVRGRAGAVIGGAAFILPGLVAILALAALFLGDPPVSYLLLGAAAATVGPWLVLLLVGCGIAEILAQRLPAATRRRAASLPVLTAVGLGGGVLLPLAWTALKVGALSYGGGSSSFRSCRPTPSASTG